MDILVIIGCMIVVGVVMIGSIWVLVVRADQALPGVPPGMPGVTEPYQLDRSEWREEDF